MREDACYGRGKQRKQGAGRISEEISERIYAKICWEYQHEWADCLRERWSRKKSPYDIESTTIEMRNQSFDEYTGEKKRNGLEKQNIVSGPWV